DGPTHQPIEHVVGLRMIPNLAVHRPADAVATAGCWQLSLERQDRPPLLCLSRQNLPHLRRERTDNVPGRGASRLGPAAAARGVVIGGTGSEVQVALAAADQLEARRIGGDVVSMPCWSLFDAQHAEYRDVLLPRDGTLIVPIE